MFLAFGVGIIVIGFSDICCILTSLPSALDRCLLLSFEFKKSDCPRGLAVVVSTYYLLAYCSFRL